MKARFIGWGMQWIAAGYCRDNIPEMDLKGSRKSIMKEYRSMIERTPSIGKSSNLINLIGACYLFSLAKVVPGMTPEMLDRVIQGSVRSDVMVRLHRGQRRKGTMFTDRVQDRRAKEAEASHASPYEFDWEYDYIKGDGEFYCTYTKCGICRLAEKEGLTEYVPTLCRMDYPSYEIAGARLIRTKTLGNGDGCCDFHVVRESPGDGKERTV